MRPRYSGASHRSLRWALVLALAACSLVCAQPSRNQNTTRTGGQSAKEAKLETHLQRLGIRNPLKEAPHLSSTATTSKTTTTTTARPSSLAAGQASSDMSPNKRANQPQPSKRESQSTSSSAPKSVQADSKLGRVIARMQGKRQVDAASLSGSASSRRNEDPWFLDQTPYPLQPYRFVYNVKGKNGQTEQYRQEVGDGKFLSGSYGYVLPDGIYRHVDYVADDRGFRAFIRTSEPGTANENPSNVVITSNPVPGAPSYQSSEGAKQNLLATAPLLPAYTPGLYDYSTLNSDRELPRRPPGSIISTPYRNFTSFAFSTPPPQITSQLVTPSSFNPVTFLRDNSSNLPSPAISTSSSRNGFDSNQAQLDNWTQSGASDDGDLFSRIQPLKAVQLTGNQPQVASNQPANYNRFNYLGNLAQSVEPTSRPAAAADQSSPSSGNGAANWLSPVRRPTLEHAFQRTGVPTNRLAYDLPLSSQGRPNANSKLYYDNKHILHPDLPYLSLERARSLAQIDQLNAASPIGLHYIRPLLSGEPGTLTPVAGPRQAAALAAGQQQIASHHFSASGHHSSQEEHHQHQLAEDAPGPDSLVSKEHHSGTKSGSVRQFEQHSSHAGHLLPPPPPYQSSPQQGLFQQHRTPEPPVALVSAGVKGGGRLQAPYAGFPQSRGAGEEPQSSAQESASSNRALDGPHQSSSGLPSSPVPPTPPSPPTPPEEPSTPSSPAPPPPTSVGQHSARSTPNEPSNGAGTPPETASTPLDQTGTTAKGNPRRSQQTVSWLGGGASSPAPAPVRAVRMPEDYRSSVMMNDLRSMQNTFGLPQPPRLHQRASLSSPAEESLHDERSSAADQIISERLKRIDELIGSSQSSRSDASQQQASSQPAEERRLRWPQSKVANEESRRLQTGPLLKASASSELQGELQGALLFEALPGANESSFDARRLSGKQQAKLQAEKVSELEKFQQRLRTQQLLLEHTKNPDKPSNRSSAASANKARQLSQQLSAEMNSFVKYDEDLADQVANGTTSARARRQDEPLGEVPSRANATPAGEPEVTRRKLTIVQHSLSARPSEAEAASGEQRRSDFAQQIKNWPSLQQVTGNGSSVEPNVIQDSDLQPKREAKSSSKPSDPKEQTKQAQEKQRVPANTINLDFINSVTALSVDHMNPFALSSVNPAVLRSSSQQPNANALAQQQSSAPGHLLSGGSGGANRPVTGGVATASARYFSSPELLASVSPRDHADLRSLLPDSTGVFAGNEDGAVSKQGGWASNHRLQAAAAARPPYTYAAPTTGDGSAHEHPHRRSPSEGVAQASSQQPKKLLGSLSLFANHRQQQVAPNVEQAKPRSPDGSNVLLSRDGFEIRDRAVQVDNHRFYEVVSSGGGGFGQPNEESTAFQAFKG